jgi:hypothetical protein
VVRNLKYVELWFFKFITFFLGCYFCFLLQSQLQLSTVLAAALTGFLGTIVPETKRIDAVHVHANIYMGAFVAMGSRVVDAGTLQILLVSFIGSTVYFIISPFFKGFGGKLGLIAFISSILGLALRHWL